jgi:hypothetical protein
MNRHEYKFDIPKIKQKNEQVRKCTHCVTNCGAFTSILTIVQGARDVIVLGCLAPVWLDDYFITENSPT